MAHIVILNKDSIDHFRFKEELKALARKLKGSTMVRPVIITIQIGETRWVWNGEEVLPA